MGDQLSDVRRSYDNLAEAYATRFADLLDDQPLDRALLGLFAELTKPGPVLDLGCGTGEISALLAGLGVEVSGVDLSPQMIRHARERHPELDFAVGSMTALGPGGLELADASVAGILAHYSTIHLSDEQLPGVFAEFARLVRPGGWAMINFQARAEAKEYTSMLEQEVALHYPPRSAQQVTELLRAAGFTPYATTIRPPTNWFESVDQAYLLVRRNTDDGSAEGESL
ncbi:class I SAM-dependent DNA methyltransferase [Propionibacteriaceae bacterium Y1685]|uniref:class I SAM-dependent DNA methyltransferase n=1 Tax=Microlunatus sp. Y1700 TaxID=3418487 RepID=UPI003B7C1317